MRKWYNKLHKLLLLINIIILNIFSIVYSDPVTGIIDKDAQDWINDNIVNPLLGLVGAVSFCLFAYGIAMFLKDRSGGGGEGHAKNKAFLLWGTLGMFVIFSVWSIVRLLGTGLVDTNVQLAL